MPPWKSPSFLLANDKINASTSQSMRLLNSFFDRGEHT
jgi:hypothetical protein